VFCDNCGASLGARERFCRACGTSVSDPQGTRTRSDRWSPPRSSLVWIIIGIVVLILGGGLALFIVFSFPQQRIEGIVFEGGFEKPLKDVSVTIKGTTFESKTNSEGKYSLDFAPGKFDVRYSKPRYTEKMLSLEVTQKTRVPAEKVALWRIPDKQGLFLFGTSDYKPLSKCTISGKTKDLGFSWNKPIFEHTWSVAGEFTAINVGNLKFMDSDPNPIGLFKIMDANGLVLHRLTYWGGGAKDQSQQLKEVTEKIGEDMTFRTTQLDPGRYAFIGKKPVGLLQSGPSDPAYCFEIKGTGQTSLGQSFSPRSIPQYRGRVNDFAGVISTAYHLKMEEMASALEKKTTAELVIVTVKSTKPETIESFSSRLSSSWRLGQKGKDKGVMIVIAVEDRTVRVEVSSGLEKIIPDALAKKFLDESILPHLRKGDYSKGIWAGAEAIGGHLIEHLDSASRV